MNEVERIDEHLAETIRRGSVIDRLKHLLCLRDALYLDLECGHCMLMRTQRMRRTALPSIGPCDRLLFLLLRTQRGI